MKEPANLSHQEWMKRALRLAARGEGLASPNPMVGAVVVSNGALAGEGYHLYDRRTHAEVAALRMAGSRSRGADLYVTLEPCCHQGRTPPCATAVVEAGVRRVFVAVKDPNPLVEGKGISYLRRRGVEVEVGLCRNEAARQNEAFFHYIRTGRPFVTLKLAMTLDGRIAASSGESKWITGAKARAYVQRLRFRSDALLVGIETVLADDPSLNVRWKQEKRITRVILDSRLRCPGGARLFESGDPVVIFHGEAKSDHDMERLGGRAALVRVSSGDRGLDWDEILTELGQRSITSLLVEGGGQVGASLLARHQANRLNFFYAPKILGSEGKDGIGPLGLQSLVEAIPVCKTSIRRLGDDFLLDGVLGDP
jgi:diaminohydroxyphosphoribosylaminopyrimidine deaminase/5-amino-6-(5-phosphoribosylamino)uracil reductase